MPEPTQADLMRLGREVDEWREEFARQTRERCAAVIAIAEASHRLNRVSEVREKVRIGWDDAQKALAHARAQWWERVVTR